jgi:hypothetical protein
MLSAPQLHSGGLRLRVAIIPQDWEAELPITYQGSPVEQFVIREPFAFGQILIDTSRSDSFIDATIAQAITTKSPTSPPNFLLFRIGLLFIDPDLGKDQQFRLDVNLIASDLLQYNVIAIIGWNILSQLDIHINAKLGVLKLKRAMEIGDLPSSE